MTRRIVNLADLQSFTAVELLSDPGHDPVPKPIPFCMEIRLDWALPDAKTGHNVLHGRFVTAFPGTVALANAIKAAMVNAWSTSGIDAYLSNNLVLNSVSLRDLSVLNSLYIISTSAPTTVGLDTALGLPLETALVITERTAISGPGGRGRIYLTGFTQTALSVGNVVNPAVMPLASQLALNIQTAINANSSTMCLRLPSRVGYTGKTGRVHPPRDATTADVIKVEVRDNHWDSQRRRGLK